MSVDRPNHVALRTDVTFGTVFGCLLSVTPVSYLGQGHSPHVRVQFRGGVSMSFDPETFASLCRLGPAALAGLTQPPNIHDSCGGFE